MAAVTENEKSTRISGPVPRIEARINVVLLAVSFGVTVVGTRLYLALTGYPQIGGGTYHIAHALWGGLLLVIGGLLPLLWANRWVLTIAALCSGAGVGLFIDEIGKFITQNNDYFSPLAAPIIYLCFLAVLWLARRTSKAREHDARDHTYAILDGLTDVADANLQPRRRQDLLVRLADVKQSPDRPDLVDLADRLESFAATASLAPPHRPWTQRPLAALERWEARLLPRPVHRLLLVAGSTVVGLFSLLGLLVLVALLGGIDDARVVFDDRTIEPGFAEPVVLLAALGETVVGVLLLASAALLLIGRDRTAIRLGKFGLVFVLAAVNVLVGYVSVELVVVAIILELIGLGLYVRYEARFLGPAAARTPTGAQTTAAAAA